MFSKIKYYFVSGLVSLIPIAITLMFLKWFFNILVGPGANIVGKITGDALWPTLVNIISFVLTIILVLVSGFIFSSVLGNYLYGKVEKIIAKIPIINTLYQTVKGITDSISAPQKQAFSKVVLIEYPKKDIWTFALVTGQSKNKENIDYYHLYLPTTPNPTSGFMLYIAIKDAIETDMSPEEAIKIIISGGAIAPDKNDIQNID